MAEDNKDGKPIEIAWTLSVKVTDGPTVAADGKPAVQALHYISEQLQLSPGNGSTPATAGLNLPTSLAAKLVLIKSDLQDFAAAGMVSFSFRKPKPEETPADKKAKSEETPAEIPLLGPQLLIGQKAGEVMQDVIGIDFKSIHKDPVKIELLIAHGDVPPTKSTAAATPATKDAAAGTPAVKTGHS